MQCVLWFGQGDIPLSPGLPYQEREVPGPCRLWVDDTLNVTDDVWVEDARGWVFVRGWGRGDIEAQVEHHWRARGVHGLSALDGALTIVFWCAQTRRAGVYRPALGMPPVMMMSLDGGTLWGHDPLVLCHCARTTVQPNMSHMAVALHRQTWSTQQDDALMGVRRVLPGHVAMANVRGQVEHLQGWVPNTHLIDEMTVSQACDALTEVVLDWFDDLSQPAHLCMSAGVDSSALALLWSRQRLEAGQTLRVSSMVTPGWSSCDESEEIGLLEAHTPIESDRVDVREHSPGTMPDLWQRHWGLGPNHHAGMTHEHAFFKAACAKHRPVTLLGGFGADEALMCLPALTYRRALHDRRRRRLMLGAPGARGGLLRQAVRSALPNTLLEFVGSFDHRTQARAPWHDHRRWVRLADLFVVPEQLGQPHLWGHHRWLMTQTWGWEWFVRTTWRHMLELGVYIDSPFLHRDVWAVCLRMPPEALMVPVPSGSRLMDKAPLRRVLERCDAPLDLRYRPKVRSFDKLIEVGLMRHMHPDEQAWIGAAIEHAVALGVIHETFLPIYRDFLSSCHANWPDGPHVGSLSIWRTLATAMWLDEF